MRKKTKFVATRRVFWYLHSIKLFAAAAVPEPAVLTYSVSRLEIGIEPNKVLVRLKSRYYGFATSDLVWSQL